MAVRRDDTLPDIIVPGTGGEPPQIRGPYGVTTESARRQCAENLRYALAHDKPKFEMVLATVKRKMGSRKKAMDWLRRAYPEAFEERTTEETTDAGQAGQQDKEG